MSIWVIVVAGGSGARFGGQPKQFLSLNDRSILDRSLDVAAEACDGVVVVLPAEFCADVDVEHQVVPGGATRSESVRAGLAAVPEDAEIILVHDAARPLASRKLYSAVIEAVKAGADAAVPGIAVVDTLKKIDASSVVVETVARDELVAVQTPQAFSADMLRRAHSGQTDASDDAGLVESLGGKIVVVPGEVQNLKITVPHDLLIAKAILDND